MKRLLLPVALFAAFLSGSTILPAADAYKWSVQYLIDNSRSVFGHSQKLYPRRNRGLAISPDGRSLYAGYHHGGEEGGEVRRIALDVADYERATLAVLPGAAGKAIATDQKGRVYIANEGEVLIYDSTLATRYLAIGVDTCEGVATAHEGGDTVLYTTDRSEGTLSRWVLSEQGDAITAAKLSGLGGNGTVKIAGAQDLRGVEVDDHGNIWVADLKDNQVIKVSSDGKIVKTVGIDTPMDIAFDGDRAFITQGEAREVTVVDRDMNVIGKLNVPWEELELSPVGNDRRGGLCGIVTVHGRGFYVSNEGGQTANQRSTYGRADERADIVNGKLFRDAKDDDNDPILFASEVTLAN